jgi:hypothetical protein
MIILEQYHVLVDRPKKNNPQTTRKKKRGNGWSDTMLSITKCKKILNKNGIEYTDNEIKILRQVLYTIADISANK